MITIISGTILDDKLKNKNGETINWIDENINPFTGDILKQCKNLD